MPTPTQPGDAAMPPATAVADLSTLRSELAAGWRSLATALELRTRVRITTRHRMIACAEDTRHSVLILEDTHRDVLADQSAQMKRTEAMSMEERRLDWARTADVAMTLVKKYATAQKAFHFFVRALQDAAYGVLLELDGKTVGQYSSIKKCFNKTGDNPMGVELRRHLPDYEGWFKRHRDLRNDMKLGMASGLSFVPNDEARALKATLYKVDEKGRSSEIHAEVCMEDVAEALRQSIALLGFVESRVPPLT